MYPEVPSNHFPIGFLPSKYCLAKDSLTIAAPGEMSLGRKSLPSMKGIFIAFIQPGETFINQAPSSIGGAPLIEMELDLKLYPSSSGQSANATVSMPGTFRKWSAT